jgi:hypothetical protein
MAFPVPCLGMVHDGMAFVFLCPAGFHTQIRHPDCSANAFQVTSAMSAGWVINLQARAAGNAHLQATRLWYMAQTSLLAWRLIVLSTFLMQKAKDLGVAAKMDTMAPLAGMRNSLLAHVTLLLAKSPARMACPGHSVHACLRMLEKLAGQEHTLQVLAK